MTTLVVGDEAPAFTLRDQNNEETSLASFRGDKAVLVVFYPAAFTGICTGELDRMQEQLTTFQNDDVQVVSVSTDSPYSQKVFATQQGFEFPLLSDFWPHGAVAQAYGVFNETAGIAERGTFLVDVDGVLRLVEHNGPGQGRDAAVWAAAVKAL